MKKISMNPLIQPKTTPRLLITLTLLFVCFGLLPKAQAVVPAPDGGYPNFTTAEGTKALQSLTTGSANTAVGWLSLFSNAAGSFNTATGAGTLLFNTADANTAFGAAALLFNTTGTNNTAVGAAALETNTTGGANTANGAFALSSNTTGTFNSAFGQAALASNTTGIDNTATGAGALFSNTTGGSNTGAGFQALNDNTTGDANTANGDRALFSNNIGSGNTADGAAALDDNTTGSANTALGEGAGSGVTTANFVICIGAFVTGANVSDTTWIGNVYGVTTQSGTTAPVIVSDTGQLGTVASSERFKKDIATMEKASEAILALRPVTFHYKTDTKGTPQFGLIAEEVAKVNPALVLPDKEGKPYTVRYDVVNAMLLNEFLKEHKKTEKLEATVASLIATVKEQAAQIQKVSAQLEASKPAPQVAENNQ
jgi:hypothetical protein